ncbi:Fe(3+)-hydroxamate ABC transporter permease FhuB [Microvirga pudoricolor]|uniref:Fe(3+)-hydroxamate ABC transporter permease FhuB n=1 Tax=Microvirga pudoricolor TaxID=2778729 RepID=UPI0019524B43|nr:Fe(3+)-hydroxamate ABC transporter permease FhuB [Microvirga pudoricolor]MBM6593312.1 Fe(3+)-hydroxamate ABC transporter permease FhuB [Microvirga pudoricolor]
MQAELRAHRAVLLTGAVMALAVGLVLVRAAGYLPPSSWFAAAFHPNAENVRELIFHYSSLPRLVTALLCGMGLGLAGALFQHILRNPLASPTTLGVEAGAQLALTIATVWAPFLLGGGREMVALAGGLASTGVIFAVAWARGFSSLSLVLTGLITGLFCGSLTVAIRLLNQEYITSLFIWGAGSLSQQDWSVVLYLLPRVAAAMAVTALIARPLNLLTLDDTSAGSLGVSLPLLRGGGLLLAVFLTSTVTSAVGVIGFIGLAAPQVARLSGARRLRDRLILSPLIGGFLLVIVDQCVQAASGEFAELLPTGAVTALFGAPLLLWLLPRLRLAGAGWLAERATAPARRARQTPLFAILSGLLILAVIVAAVVGRGPDGFAVADADTFALLAPWRLPRVAVALMAGAMLAVAGVLIQRLTQNPMASPEILGIGTGVALGLIVAMILSPAPSRSLQFATGSAGALAVLALLLWSGVRSRFSPDFLLLTGIALSAFMDALVVSFLAVGDPRASQLLAWIAGSTYRADDGSAGMTLAVAMPLLAAAPLLSRWLDILPLGEDAARGLGVDLRLARFSLMLLAALLTAAAVLVTGPLSFVGLVGPHLARMLGLNRALPQLAAAALIGAVLMVSADWVGRLVIYPLQLPAGVVAALIGVPYLIWHLMRRER